ncbi:MAG TPA: hypothetical protein QF873_01940 [Patescibacteria group bacterium]|nr:hypothetical protein [Patescibacteria group bacterium]
MSEYRSQVPPREMIDRQFEELSDEPSFVKYRPSFLGNGEEQVVFDFEDHPDVVGKVPVYTMKKIMSGTCELDQEIARDRLANKELRHHFGRHALREYVGHQTVEVSEEIHDFMFSDNEEGDPPPDATSVDTLIRIQDKIPAEVLDGVNQDGASALFLESKLGLSLDDFRLFAGKLADGQGDIDRADMDRLMGARERNIADLIGKDESFKAAVTDFVGRAMIYTKDTGKTLDIMGHGNLLYFIDGEKWDYLLVDAKDPWTGALDFADNAMEKLLAGEELERWEVSGISKQLSYASTLNMLANLCGLPDRLEAFSFDLSELSDEELTDLRSVLSASEQKKMDGKIQGLWDHVQQRPEDVSMRGHLLQSLGYVGKDAPDPRIDAILTEFVEYLDVNPDGSFEDFHAMCTDVVSRLG